MVGILSCEVSQCPSLYVLYSHDICCTLLTTGEGEEHQEVEKTKFTNIQNHPAQRDLEGTEVRIDREDVDQLEGGEDVGGSEQALNGRLLKETRSQPGMDRTDQQTGSELYILWPAAVWCCPKLFVFCLQFCLKSF